MNEHNLVELSAVSPLDGRYRCVAARLAPYFSELGLIRFRVKVEVEYFLALVELGLPELSDFPRGHVGKLRRLVEKFDVTQAERIKTIERTTNHDVKAVEYFLREAFTGLGLEKYREFIHFGLTSQDINDTAIPLSLRAGLNEVVLPELRAITSTLRSMAERWEGVVMLARTHGQPATPTRMGKELMVFVERLERELGQLENVRYLGKFGGASGNLNAHYAAFPKIDWVEFAESFLSEKLELERARYTTQIIHHENLAMIFDGLNRISGILLDLSQDMWLYILQDYFSLRVVAGEVGSSAMPHKVNPIDFENAEGNLGMASAVLSHLGRKLAVSRLQRDLSDYTLKRNIGVALGHLLVSAVNINKGLNKLQLNQARLNEDLDGNLAVVSEAVQTILRRHGAGHAYEEVRLLSRGRKLDRQSLEHFVSELDLERELKQKILDVTPFNFVGPIY